MRARLVWIAITLLTIASLALSGCATRAETGTLVGAGTGAALGGAVTRSGWGALLGGALGAFIGREVGMELDRRDQQRFAYALSEVPTGQEYTWVNPDTGAYWEMTPRQTYRAPQGYPCREFSVLARVRGQVEETYGTACLQPDGSWEMIG